MAKENKLIKAVNFRDFDWNKAKLFYHIAKCGSFNKAARLAGTDQAALSRQIQALEKQIGYPLLIRKPGGISLTRKGGKLLEKVAPFFLEMRGFCGNNHVEIKNAEKRKIRVLTTHSLANYILNDLFLAYIKKVPSVSFEVICEDFNLDIILSDSDIAIHHLDSNLIERKIDGIEYEYLFSLEKKLFASLDYIDINGEPQSVEELADHHVIAFPQSEIHHLYEHINWILSLGRPKGKLHNPIYTSNSSENQIEAAKQGIGIVSSYNTYKIIKNSGLKNILPEVKGKPFKEYFIYPTYHKDDKVIMDIKYFLKDKLSKA